MSHYSQYRGRNAGRIIHFLHYYCPYHMATNAEIGANTISYNGRKIATFSWLEGEFGMGDVPIFEFIEEFNYCNITNRDCRPDAIDDSIRFAIVPTQMEPLNDQTLEVFRAMNHNLYMQINIYAGVFKKDKSFFFADKTIWAKIGAESFWTQGDELFKLDQDLKCWLLWSRS